MATERIGVTLMNGRLTLLLRALCACALAVGSALLIAHPGPVQPAHATAHGPSVVTSDPRFGAVEAFHDPADASAIGVRWERITFWWKEFQKTGPGTWDGFANSHDAFITSELAAGRHLVGLLINTPDWAAAVPSQHGASPPKGLYLPYNDPRNYWGQFVAMAAKRYAGRIDEWIIWNEVNIPNGRWSTWKGSRADYAQLVKVAYLAAKAANPRAKIVLFGDPYWYDHGAYFLDVLKRLTADPGAGAHHNYFDIANLHLYSRPKDMATLITWYRAQLAHYGIDCPIWISETNAIPYDDPLRPYPKGGFKATMDDQASFIVEAFAIDLAMGVQRIEVNRMVDGTDFTAGGEPFGLVRNNGSVRPAYDAYKTVSNYFAHVTDGTLSVDPVTGVYRVVLHRPGATVTVLWDQKPLAATATVAALGPTALVVTKLDESRVVQAHGGRFVFRLAAATGNTNSADPLDYVMGGSPVIVVQTPKS
jgi:hypothetical protein